MLFQTTVGESDSDNREGIISWLSQYGTTVSILDTIPFLGGEGGPLPDNV